MTNQEYEAASIAAAGCYDRFEGEHKLRQWDEHIATLEATLAKAQEARREIVNQYSLNKACSHIPKVIVPGTEGFPDGGLFCEKCGIDMHCEHDISWKFVDGWQVDYCVKCGAIMP